MLLSCPTCQMQMMVPDGTPAGAHVSCPGCKTLLAVPALAVAAAVQPTPPPLAPAPAPQSRRRDPYDDPEDVRDIRSRRRSDSFAAPPDWRRTASALYLMKIAATIFSAVILINVLGELAILAFAESRHDETSRTITTLTYGLVGILAAGCMVLALVGRFTYARLKPECGGGELAATAAFITGVQLLLLTVAFLVGVLELAVPLVVMALLILWLLLYVVTEIFFLVSLGRAVKRLHRGGIVTAAVLFWVALGLGSAGIVAVWFLNTPTRFATHDFTAVYNGIASDVVLLLVWLLYLNILSVAQRIVRRELKQSESDYRLEGSE
jgi:hypothetical protein